MDPVLSAVPGLAPASVGILKPSAKPGVEHHAALYPLYVSFVALQVLDVDSTLRAIHNGGHEGNPIVGSALGSPAGIVALKAAAVAGVIGMSEHVWKHHRVAAVMTMIVLNGAYAAVVSHNYAIGR